MSGAFEYGSIDLFIAANGVDEIVLTRPDGVRVDVVRYDNGLTFPDPAGASMSLCPMFLNAADNDDGTNWIQATTTFGAGDEGTPGAPNESCAPVLVPLR